MEFNVPGSMFKENSRNVEPGTLNLEPLYVSAASESVQLDHVLDATGTTEQKVAVCVHGKAAGDQ